VRPAHAPPVRVQSVILHWHLHSVQQHTVSRLDLEVRGRPRIQASTNCTGVFHISPPALGRSIVFKTFFLDELSGRGVIRPPSAGTMGAIVTDVTLPRAAASNSNQRRITLTRPAMP